MKTKSTNRALEGIRILYGGQSWAWVSLQALSLL